MTDASWIVFGCLVIAILLSSITVIIVHVRRKSRTPEPEGFTLDSLRSLLLQELSPELRGYLRETEEPNRARQSGGVERSLIERSLIERIARIAGYSGQRPQESKAIQNLIVGAALLEARVDELAESQVTESKVVKVVLGVLVMVIGSLVGLLTLSRLFIDLRGR